MRLEGKVAIVTGAASGYGKRSAEMFAMEGAGVAAVDIHQDGLEGVVAGIRRQGAEAIGVVADITRTDDVRKIMADTVQAFGKINVLFNNAGVDHMDRVVDVTEEDWDRVLAVNLKGCWLCSKYAIPHLIQAGGGSVIHTSSLSALKGRVGNACYGASKAGVLAFSQIMAVELAPHRIRSNCICPVVATTPMGERFVRKALKLYGMEVEGDWDFEKAKPLATTAIPMQMLSEPEDIAYAAIYLASDESRLVSGTYILIDGAARAA
ncbi:MAG: SDR family oxidoreductase [bacterium]